MHKHLFTSSVIILAALITVALVGCGTEQAHKELSTPENTIKTYLRYASGLTDMVSLPHYQRALSCFTRTDQQWFDKNFESLLVDPQDPAYMAFKGMQKKAYVFGIAIARKGPKIGDPFTVKTTGVFAQVYFRDYRKPVHLVKEGPNWRIKGLFLR